MYKRKSVLQELETQIKTSYIVIPSEISVDGVTETTYGIGAIQNDILVDSVLDISVEKEKVASVVASCNSEGLELCHLHAVAEDTAI